MKLVFAVVHDRDRNHLGDALIKAGYTFTRIASTGGFLRDGNTTLLIGVENEQLDAVIETIKENCKSRQQYINILPPDIAIGSGFFPAPQKVEVGGAVVFCLDVERYEHF